METTYMLVTNKAPDFTATTVLGNNEIVEDFNLYENFGENGTVLFFYPLDFTFVCPSEIIAFDHRLDEFKSRGIEVIGVSIDSQFSHFAWKNTPVNEGGIGQIRYPLVADLTKEIAKSYDVLLDGGVALRGSFLIDKDGIDEMIRMVDAMLFTNEHGEVCAAGWNKGDEGMKASTEGVAEYLAKHESEL